MNTTSFKQKILLFIFSLFLTLVLLEVFLRLSGAFVLFLQERHNHVSFNPDEYRILCLGESTTALGGEDSYPSQLEVMLNAQSRQKKFTVINKGLISTTSNYILAHLDQNLNTYKPQMVVVMMGINDRAYLRDFHKALWWERIKLYLEDFRTFKLGYLLYEHITHRIKEIHAPEQVMEPTDEEGKNQVTEDFLKSIISKCIIRFTRHMAASVEYQKDQRFSEAQQEKEFARESLFDASSAYVELARRYRLHGQYPQARQMLEEAVKFNPDSSVVYEEWGNFYLAQQMGEKAVKAFQMALGLDPKDTDDLLGLAHAYYQEHNEEAFVVYAGYLQINPQDYWGYIELARWLKTSGHEDLAQEYLNRARKIAPDFDRIQKAAATQMPEYCPATFVNFRLLVDKILSHHMTVVIMQYPLRDIGILKDYLGQREGLIYVENRQNFLEALTKQGYSYYFKDNFAYNFGHCTRMGNELIAHNLAGVILNNE